MSLLDEQLSAQFQAWERRGRGWQVFDGPVDPEPPFRPFNGHYLPRAPLIDDGRRPTVLSSLFQRLGRKLSTELNPETATLEPEAEPQPQPLLRDALVELM